MTTLKRYKTKALSCLLAFTLLTQFSVLASSPSGTVPSVAQEGASALLQSEKNINDMTQEEVFRQIVQEEKNKIQAENTQPDNTPPPLSPRKLEIQNNNTLLMNQSSEEIANQEDPNSITTQSPQPLSTESGIPQTIKPPFHEQYNVANNGSEFISLNTGSLNYTHNILSLPGKNGLDLNLNLIYSSSSATVDKEAIDTTDVWLRQNYTYGFGWRMGLPAVQQDEELLLSDGRSFKIRNGVISGKYTQDFSWSHRTDGSVLSYKDGRKDYFDMDGYVTSSVDKFGNTISYTYRTISYTVGNYMSLDVYPDVRTYNVKVLDKIIDTLGREITFSYEVGDGNEHIGIRKMAVHSGGIHYGTFLYNSVDTTFGKVNVLSKITLDDGNSYAGGTVAGAFDTTFEYEKASSALRYTLVTDEREWTERLVSKEYLLMKKINHYTGGSTKYDYVKVKQNFTNELSELNWSEGYKIERRAEIDSNGLERNTKRYYYEGDSTGFPSSGVEEDTGEIKDQDYSYHTIIYEDINDEITKKKKTIYTFNHLHQKIEEVVTNTNGVDYIPMIGYSPYKQNADVVGNQLLQMGASITNKIYTTGVYFEKTQLDYDIYRGYGTYATNLSQAKQTSLFSEGHPYTIKKLTYNNKIYLFVLPYSEGIFYLSIYDVLTDTWSTGGVPIESTASKSSVIFSSGNEIWIHNSINHYMIYNCDTGLWSGFMNYDCQTVLAQANGKIYCTKRNNYTDYLYILDAGTRTSVATDVKLDFAYNNVFELNNKLYFLTNYYPNSQGMDRLYIYDAETNALTLEHAAPFPIETAYFFKDEQGNACAYLAKDTTVRDVSYKRGIYQFDPDLLKWNYIYETVFSTSTVAGVTASADGIYIDNNSFIEVFRGNGAPNAKKAYTYDSYRLLEKEQEFVYSNSNTPDKTYTKTWEHNKYGDTTKFTDFTGDVTEYTYLDNSNGIPLTVNKSYANDGGTETVINTLTPDNTRISATVTTYTDGISEMVTYEYADTSSPGNVTKESHYSGAGENAALLNAIAYEYAPSFQNAYVTKKTKYDSNMNADTAIVEQTDYDRNTGLIKSSTDTNGLVSTFTYNSKFKNAIQGEYYSDGSKKEYAYYSASDFASKRNAVITTVNGTYRVADIMDDFGRVKKVAEVSSSQYDFKETKELASYSYNSNGNVYSYYDANGSGQVYFYDLFNRVITILNTALNVGYYTAQGISYNNDGTEAIVSDGDGGSVHLYSDKKGQLLKRKTYVGDGAYSTNEYTYDPRGNVIGTVDPEGNQTTFVYDGKNNLVCSTNALHESTSYTYDAYGNLLTMTTPKGSQITNEYDGFGRVIKSTDQMGNYETYTYDKVGNIKTYTDRNGVTSTTLYEFEIDGRPRSYRVASRQDGDLDPIIYTYDVFGNLLSEIEGSNSTQYSYTYDNRLEKVTTPDNKSITYAYDPAGNITSMKDYFGERLDYSYDFLNRVEKITHGAETIAAYSYYNDNTLRQSIVGGITTDFTYDNANRLLEKKNTLENALGNFTYQYQYDKIGNIIREDAQTATDSIGGTNNTSYTINYTYDALSRLIRTQDGRTNAITEYAFDPNGNIMTKDVQYNSPETSFTFQKNGTQKKMTDLSYHSVNYTYDAANRLLQTREFVAGSAGTDPNGFSGIYEGIERFDYDGNGNLIMRTRSGVQETQTEQYAYNAHGQMSAYTDPSGEVYNYTYSPGGMRIAKEHNGSVERYYYDNGKIVNEANGNGSLTARNVFGIEGIAARTNAGQTTQYMIKNGHNDVVGTCDGTTVSARYDYDAYGAAAQTEQVANNPFGYCGEYFDYESGLLYLRARYYDPALGRFTQEDPAKDGGNWYSYCGGNPVNFWDPTGMVAYEKFASATEAAIDWAWNYYGITDYTLFEVGSLIFSVSDKNGNVLYYSYTDAVVGSPHEVDTTKVIDMVPEGATVVGNIHSHPHGPDFSDNDIEDGKNRGYDYLFVVTPTGDREVADVHATTVWDNYKTPSYSVGTVRYNKLDVHRQVKMHNKFYRQWHDHYNDSHNSRWCNKYDCRTLEWPREYK